MSSTILHSCDEGSKTPLAKKFTYLYLTHESRKNQERKWNCMSLWTGWKWGCVCFYEFHLILCSIPFSRFLGIWFVPPQPIEKTAGRADLRKSIFFLPVRSFGYLSNRAGCRNNFSSREGQSKLDLIREEIWT